MAKPHFPLRLTGPRPTFPADITEATRAIRARMNGYTLSPMHLAAWRGSNG